MWDSFISESGCGSHVVVKLLVGRARVLMSCDATKTVCTGLFMGVSVFTVRFVHLTAQSIGCS